MKTIVPSLLLGCVVILLPLGMIAQVEGKHLGSTQDAQRTGTPLYTKSAADPSKLPAVNNSGSKIGKELYSQETGMYLDEKWKPGFAVLADQTQLDNLLLRYDIYHQQMQFISAGDTMAYAHPEELDYLVIDGKKFIFQEYEKDNIRQTGYFEVLKDGDCQLLLMRSVTHHIHGDNLAGESREKYIRDIKYFVKKDNLVAREIRACRKSVLHVFQDQEEAVRGFIKNNDLKMRSCEDLMQVVSFYNSLEN